MCNAFTHLKSCKCGFGHDGLMRYSNYYEKSLDDELNHLANNFFIKSTGRAYPNYRCKCCGEKVFFFHSIHGGKVLFDSLGKPWPKHDCLGIVYERKKEKLKISNSDWRQVIGLLITPSDKENFSTFSGVVSSFEGSEQFSIELTIASDDPLLIKDLYVDACIPIRLHSDLEALLLKDDGSHFVSFAKVASLETFEMSKLNNQKPYSVQPKLI